MRYALLSAAFAVPIAGALILGLDSRAASAQQASGLPRARHVPVTVVLLDSLPGGNAAAVVVRNATGGQDQILLSRKAAAGNTLAAAVQTLLDSWSRWPAVSLPANTHVRVPGIAAPAGWKRSHLEAATRAVVRLRTTEPRYLPAFGIVRAAEISVAPPRLAQ